MAPGARISPRDCVAEEPTRTRPAAPSAPMDRPGTPLEPVQPIEPHGAAGAAEAAGERTGGSREPPCCAALCVWARRLSGRASWRASYVPSSLTERLKERRLAGMCSSLIGCVVSVLPPPTVDGPRPRPHLPTGRGEVPEEAGDMAPAGRIWPRFWPSMMPDSPFEMSARSVDARCMLGVVTALGRLSSGEGTIPLLEKKPDMYDRPGARRPKPADSLPAEGSRGSEARSSSVCTPSEIAGPRALSLMATAPIARSASSCSSLACATRSCSAALACAALLSSSCRVSTPTTACSRSRSEPSTSISPAGVAATASGAASATTRCCILYADSTLSALRPSSAPAAALSSARTLATMAA
mmetsp:Transcript_36509/g.91067  ORF Transcript_36509/g.91067 Transcript_36509/m.91067 type:complete len:356 (-) Transcript_36509:1194-2261(-)